MSDISALKQIVEGAILAADRPLSIDQMISLFEQEQPARADVREVLEQIGQECDGRGFELKEVASGYRFQVRQEYGEWVGRLWDERPPRYSRALLETLALISYKQPITRGDIEEIRGVAVSTNIMRSLLEREWVRVVGHRDVPGRPAIYATTKTFLDYFNLNSLDELPTLSEIKDLDKVNEELDLEEELIEVRSLELDPSDVEDLEGLDDADLDKVTEQVNEIQDNIKNLFAPKEEEDDPEEDEDEDENVSSSESVEVATSETEEVATQQEAADEQETRDGDIPTLMNSVPEDILNAAFADDEPEVSVKTPAVDEQSSLMSETDHSASDSDSDKENT
jgi:segregation and condensation protein B